MPQPRHAAAGRGKAAPIAAADPPDREFPGVSSGFASGRAPFREPPARFETERIRSILSDQKAFFRSRWSLMKLHRK